MLKVHIMEFGEDQSLVAGFPDSNGPVGSKQLKRKCCNRLNSSALQPGELLFLIEALKHV